MRAGSRGQISGAINRLFRAGTAVGLSDGQLLERFIQSHDEGAESAFNVLLECHGPMVLAVCRRVLQDSHDAQDAFQATFLVLVRKAGTVRKRESIADWLYGVALRVSAHARVRAARRRSVERAAVTGPLIACETTPDIDVRDEVEHLPHDLRSAVVLCYLEGLTHEQAAQRLGWPVGTVRSRLARARARLRADMTRRGIGPDNALLSVLALAKTSLPEGLVDATVKAAMLLAARDAGEAGLVSAAAVALTEGVLRTMLVSKLKMTMAIALAVGAITSGAGLYAYQNGASGSAPADLKPLSKEFDNRNVKELDAFATRLEQVVRRIRQAQAKGEWDQAVAYLGKATLVVVDWQEALLARQRSARADQPPPPTSVAPPAQPTRVEPPAPPCAEPMGLPTRAEPMGLPTLAEPLAPPALRAADALRADCATDTRRAARAAESRRAAGVAHTRRARAAGTRHAAGRTSNRIPRTEGRSNPPGLGERWDWPHATRGRSCRRQPGWTASSARR